MRMVDQLTRLRPRAQRLLALTVVPAALGVMWSGVVWPVWHAYEAQVQWRATAALQLAKRRGVARIEEAVRAQSEALPKFQSWQKLFPTVAGGSPVIALQTEVNAVLNSARARPQTIAPLEATRVGALQKVGLRVVVPMTIDQLKEVVTRVGELTHLVRIERLLVNAPPAQTPSENPTLLVTLDVAGYSLDASAARSE